MDISGKTKLYALIGDPVSHSISPKMHNTAFEENEIDGRYLAFQADQENLKETVDALKRLGVRGWNVTMPCKSLMAEYCDVLSKEAQISGAVNTVVNDNGVLTGYSTDGIGFFRNLKEQGLDITGKKIILAGAGGAARAIAAQAALEDIGELVIFNRTVEKAEKVIDDISEEAEKRNIKISAKDLYDREALKKDLEDAYLFINATSVGMNPELGEERLLEPEWLPSQLNVADIVYNPIETELLKAAKERGCNTINGLGMVLWQGAYAFNYWTGTEFPVEIVKEQVFDVS